MMRPGVCSLRGHDRGEPDRARADDRDGVARLDAAVENADLVRGRQDVGEEEHLLVAQVVRHLVDGRVGERHPGELGLQAVDQMAEDPAPAAAAEAVVASLQKRQRPHDVMHETSTRSPAHDGCDRGADLDDRADGLVAEDRARLHLGHVALEDVQVRAADRGRVDADDRVRRLEDGRVGNGFPRPLSRAVIHECFHFDLRVSCLGGSPRRSRGFIGGHAQPSCGLSTRSSGSPSFSGGVGVLPRDCQFGAVESASGDDDCSTARRGLCSGM